MAHKTNSVERFWKELKRRKVVHVIMVYAATAFVILELVSMVARPLKLPEWTEAFVIILLCIGFLIAVLLSWIYDITPAGVKKTKPVSQLKQVDHTTHEVSKGWKIATYVSALVIIALLIFNFINQRSLNTGILNLDKSIAVLPFINESPVDSNKHFINGIMEEVLTNLQTIKDFRVLSRTSTDQYKGPARPTIPEIAKKLNVNYIVEGSGEKYGNMFRLRVQLIQAKGKETHLWAKSFEQEIKETKDIFRVQSQIAKSIAEELKATITPEEKQLIERTPTISLTALDFFQRGRDEHTKYWIDNSKIGALENAISYYKLALKNDSAFAQAYTGLAMARSNSYWRNVYTRLVFSENDLKILKDSVISLVDKALYFDNNLEEAILIKGWLLSTDNPDAAIKQYRKALEINPNYSFGYWNIGLALFYDKNEHIKGIKYMFNAIELERGPLLQNILGQLGFCYEALGFYKNAIEVYDQVFQLTKDTLRYYENISGPYFAEENWEESIRWAEKIIEKNPSSSWAHSQLADIYTYLRKDDLFTFHAARVKELYNYYPISIELHKGLILWEKGRKVQADSIFGKIEDFSKYMIKAGEQKENYRLILAGIYSLTGEQKKAIEYLNDINEDSAWFLQRWVIIFMENTPMFKNIKFNERFQEILNNAKSNWQKEHDKVRIWLEENDLLKI